MIEAIEWFSTNIAIYFRTCVSVGAWHPQILEHHFWHPRILTLFILHNGIVDTVQDFLIKLGIKPIMHLLKISILSLNIVIIRLTKIMNNLVKVLKILSFKVIFQCLKWVESLQFFFVKNI